MVRFVEADLQDLPNPYAQRFAPDSP